MKKKNLIVGLSIIVWTVSSCGEKESANIPPSKPTPMDGATYTCEVIRPTLRWNCSDINGDDLTYTLKFGKSATNLNKQLLSNASLQKLEYTFSEELEKSTKYFWQVIASDGKDKMAGDVWEFSTLNEPKISVVPSTPIIFSPKRDIPAGNIEFIWSIVEDDKGMENITFILNVNGEETEVIGSSTKQLSLAKGACKWFVTAFDQDGNGSESEHIQFMLE